MLLQPLLISILLIRKKQIKCIAYNEAFEYMNVSFKDKGKWRRRDVYRVVIYTAIASYVAVVLWQLATMAGYACIWHF